MASTDLDTPVRRVGHVWTAGAPGFDDARLATRARESGDAAAWTLALELLGPCAAALAARNAFAVGIVREDGTAFLAVDRFAIHSLCYRVIDGQLRFAERADALADPRPEIDPQALFDYLYFHTIPSPRTVFKDVYRLPPGHCAVFEHGRVSVQRYWKPTFEEARDPHFPELRQRLRQLLKDAVARQLDGTKPACFLSGGTDSSTVAGMIREASGKSAATYSIGFEAQGYDEMAYARTAARHFGTEHHEYYVTPDDLVRSVGPVARHYDQPFGNSSALPAYYCAKMAHDDGVARILAGDGGDELFGGNSRYAMQRIFGVYGRLPQALRRRVMEPVLLRTRAGRAPLLRKGASYVRQANTPMPDRLQNYNLLLRLGIEQILEPGFASRVDAALPLSQQRQAWDEAETAGELNRTLAYDWRYTLAESDLPKVGMTTQLAGLTVGYPMLDNALIEFSLGLPESYKLRGLRLRWFFKEALRGFLPDAIIRKKKQGFGLPFGVWVTRHEALRRLATESLLSLGTRGIVRPAFIGTLLNERLFEHPAYYGEMVWILMMLEQWLQGHAPDVRLSDRPR